MITPISLVSSVAVVDQELLYFHGVLRSVNLGTIPGNVPAIIIKQNLMPSLGKELIVRLIDHQTCYRLLSKLITNDYNYFQSYD